MFISMRLAKSGYFRGDPQEVLKAPLSVVQNVLHFESFEYDYETEYDVLNATED